MANQKDQKQKLLAIQKLFYEKTDPSHPITLAQITEELAAQDIDAERKSIYACIDALRKAGMDIQTKRDPYPAYYLAEHPLSYEEATLLLNVIQANPTINAPMRKRLTTRVNALVSEGMQQKAKVRIETPEQPGLRSKLLYRNLTRLQYAIRSKLDVFFFYYSVGIDGKQAAHKKERHTVTYKSAADGKRHRGKHYTFCNPVRLVYMSGYYYLVCWHAPSFDGSKEGTFKTYRVDRIAEVHVTQESEVTTKLGKPAKYNPEEMEDHAFGMFVTGKGKESITLLVEDKAAEERGYSWIMGAFYDKFGKSMDVYKLSETRARVFVKTVASPQFFSWLLQFGGAVKIEKPSRVAKQYVEEYLKPALAQYE